jgi:uncharacterized membrane protein
METNTRIIAKAACWQASGLVVMTTLGYAFTGSVSQSGMLALSTTIVGLVAFFAHEKLWARIPWGRITIATHEA